VCSWRNFGQAITVYIVTNQNLINEKDVFKFCTENLELFAVPKYIEFVKSLPRTAHGKTDKKLLKSPV